MSPSDKTINEAMLLLAKEHNAIFVGQGVAYDGVATYHHLDGVPMSQRVEFPAAEELQLGYCTGLAMQGFLPIAVFPRIDFLLRALDQLVNHLDKLPLMSCGQWKPKVIIRTRVGQKTPLDAGPQHTNEYSYAFKAMLTTVGLLKINHPDEILPAYRMAIDRQGSTLIVENLP